jgi:uroporphyrinogen-III synthase
VVQVQSGSRNFAVADGLRRRGARLKEVCPYEWALPEDLGPITGVVHDVIAHRIDAVLFTNQTQCRHLFQVASEMSRAEGLALSLNQQIVVGALGPVCAKALQTVGVTPDVIPSAHTLPSLITAVAEYFDKQPSGI